jgi:Flp pilus assembly protein TadG
MKRTSWMRRLHSDVGSNIVEFSLCCSIWFICALGVIYASVLVYADHFVTNAAKEAARYAIVRGSSWNGASCSTTTSANCTATADNVRTYIQSVLPPGLATNYLQVSATWPGKTPSGATCDTLNGSNSPNCAVSVQVTYSFAFPMPFIPQKAVPLSATSEMSILE